MTTAYQKLLLTQLRLAAFRKDAAGEMKDGNLVKAMTANENLAALGYTLCAADVLKLAVSSSLDGFVDHVASLMDTVDAAPMYPDFPTQVMSMDEAQFRFHQLVHYFTTYGVEALFGVKIQRGWLPDVKSTPKTERDTRLLDLRVLELIDYADAYLEPARRILCKRERMTLPEQEIVQEAVRHLSADELASLEIPFKENMEALIQVAFDQLPAEDGMRVMRALCKHTGDVLEQVARLLKTHRHHFRTSQKRMLVKLIETYPVPDWKANVILTDKKAEKTIRTLDHLDYTVYARSQEHRQVVDSLRSGELQSWEGQAKALLRDDPREALGFIAKRPGMLLRMTAWLLRLGIAPDEIAQKLCDSAATLSTQTVMTVCNFFGADPAARRTEANDVYEVMEKTLAARLACAKTPFAGQKVYVDAGNFDLALSELKCNKKSAEGGYVSSGTVYKIPDEARYVRFFCYWNDATRVDVDLHARARDLKGNDICIGWNSGYNNSGIVFSGDITHSDAAEYIDVDLSAPISRVAFNLHLFSGKPSFADVQTCFTGLMAVDQIGTNVQLYDPANCFYSTQVRSRCTNMQYGYLDVQNRTLVFDGLPTQDVPNEWYRLTEHSAGRMNVAHYLELLLAAQGCERVEDREDADTVLVIEKAQAENELSLIDNNYFMDA